VREGRSLGVLGVKEESPQYLWVYMMHLRQKLEPNPREPRYLMTDAGVGYRLVVD
jgi:two-component system KDP operon response regulator KdpE